MCTEVRMILSLPAPGAETPIMALVTCQSCVRLLPHRIDMFLNALAGAAGSDDDEGPRTAMSRQLRLSEQSKLSALNQKPRSKLSHWSTTTFSPPGVRIYKEPKLDELARLPSICRIQGFLWVFQASLFKDTSCQHKSSVRK